MGWWTHGRSRRLGSGTRNGAGNDAIGAADTTCCRWSAGAGVGAPATWALLLLLLFATALPLAGRTKNKLSYGEGLAVNIPAPESEVEKAVEDVTQNGVIRGTKEYNKDEFVAGAKPSTSSRVFPAWTEGGKVFYKVREQALDPRNFKDSSDSGTLVVRYVVRAQGEKNTILRIDALFKEDFRHIVHQSNGSVENAEYQDIREHIDAVELMKRQNVEAEKERQEALAKKQNPVLQADPSSAVAAPSAAPQAAESPSQPSPQPGAAESAGSGQSASTQGVASEMQPSSSVSAENLSGQALEERVKDLRHQVERLVKSPGAPLKSAPFHTASTLETLPTGTEILILVSTTYWYGVETHEGQHGWIMRDELEQK